MPERGLPPSSRSSAWARTVLPAPVSPVSTLSPSPSRSSARSMRRRFSTRSSSSTRWMEPPGADGSPPRARLRNARVHYDPWCYDSGTVRLLSQAPEALPQPVVEARARKLGEQRVRAREVDRDVLARGDLRRRPAVDVHLDRLLAGGVVNRQRVPRRDDERACGQ